MPDFNEQLADVIVAAMKHAAAPMLARVAALERQREQDAGIIAALRERVAVLESKA